MRRKIWSIMPIRGMRDGKERKESSASGDGKPEQQSKAVEGAARLRSNRDKVDVVIIRGVCLPMSRRCAYVTTGDIRVD